MLWLVKCVRKLTMNSRECRRRHRHHHRLHRRYAYDKVSAFIALIPLMQNSRNQFHPLPRSKLVHSPALVCLLDNAFKL